MSMNDELQTIEGKDLEDCKKKLHELYGRDYNITDTKTQIRTGFLGLTKKSSLKVWYNVKTSSPVKNIPEPPRPMGNFVIPDSLFTDPSSRYSNKNINSDFQKNRDEIIQQATGGNVSMTNFLQVKQLGDEMKSQMTELDEKLNLIFEKTKADDAHPSITKIVGLLEENDFSASFIKEIKNRLVDELTLSELDDFDEVQKIVVDWIGNKIKISSLREHKKPNVIIIVGPTGVGKTTTIAKLTARTLLAAKNSGQPKPSVFMLTIDNMRVGAKEQLQKYADSMEVLSDSAETPEDVKQIYEKIKKDTDILLIDTSGFSPNDYENIGKMRKVLDINGMDAEIYLAVDATKTASVVKSVMQTFEPFGYEGLIMTKCDETEKFGGILSAVIEKGKSVAFIADGQKAHTNLFRATKQYFLKRLYNFKIDPEHLDDLFPEEK